MKIRAGFNLAFECPQPTPMLLALDVHPSRHRDLLSDATIRFDPPTNARAYLDGFGNACTRITAPAGILTISTEFEIHDSGRPDAVAPNAIQHAIADLPDEVLVYLLGSRYCDTDRLADFAWANFSEVASGWARVQTICDFVHNHIAFDYQNADPLRTAHGGYMDQVGVCRDFAHLAITLCRCMNIPARYCTG
jgi:transglutaminase-like putative cysteine protease